MTLDPQAWVRNFSTKSMLRRKRLAHHPEIHRIRFADVRRAPVHRFKFYGLYYLIHDAEVWVIAVHHGRRHPRWLQERRKEVG